MSVYFSAHSFNSIQTTPPRYVFIHIPRTGGESLIRQIKKFCEYHIDGEPHQMANAIEDKTIQKITVVRHPADRLVSIFNRLWLVTQEMANKSFRRKGVPLARRNLYKLEKSDINQLIQMDQQKMIAEFDVTEGFWSWGMTPCQTAFIDNDTEVHKFEDKTIWKKLDLPEHKENHGSNRWSTSALTTKSLDIIRDKFKSDYEKFGYKY